MITAAQEGPERKGPTWVQTAINVGVIVASIVTAGATARFQIGDLEKRMDASESGQAIDHDAITTIKQDVHDLHEWLRPIGPWEKR